MEDLLRQGGYKQGGGTAQPGARKPGAGFKPAGTIGADSMNSAGRVNAPKMSAIDMVKKNGLKAAGVAGIGYGLYDMAKNGYDMAKNGVSGDSLMNAASGLGTALIAAPHPAAKIAAGGSVLARLIPDSFYETIADSAGWMPKSGVGLNMDEIRKTASEFPNGKLARTLNGTPEPQAAATQEPKLGDDILKSPSSRPVPDNQIEQPQTQAKADPLESLRQIAMQQVNVENPQIADGADTSNLQQLRDALVAQAQERLGDVQNPLKQETNFKVKNTGDNPLAALGQLNSAIATMIPQAVANRQARNSAKMDLALADSINKNAATDSAISNTQIDNQMRAQELGRGLQNDAQAERERDFNRNANLTKLGETLQDSAISREDAQMKLDQSKQLRDAVAKLNASTDETERMQLRDSISAMLGKDVSNKFDFKEIGGGTDPATGLPLPKELVRYNTRTGDFQKLNQPQAATKTPESYPAPSQQALLALRQHMANPKVVESFVKNYGEHALPDWARKAA